MNPALPDLSNAIATTHQTRSTRKHPTAETPPAKRRGTRQRCRLRSPSSVRTRPSSESTINRTVTTSPHRVARRHQPRPSNRPHVSSIPQSTVPRVAGAGCPGRRTGAWIKRIRRGLGGWVTSIHILWQSFTQLTSDDFVQIRLDFVVRGIFVFESSLFVYGCELFPRFT